MISTPRKCMILPIVLATYILEARSQAITEDHPLYYKKRVNRAEGIYTKPLNFVINPDKSNSNFIVVGYTLGKFYFVKDIKEVLSVQTTQDADLVGRSSANDLSYKYRLDAVLRRDHNSFSWPIKDVVWHLSQLTPDNMGVFGYDHGVYIPISIVSGSFINDSTLRVHLTSKVPVKDLKYRLLDKDGRLFEYSQWMEVKVNGKTFVRAGQLLVVTVANVSGKCVLEIQGVSRDTLVPIADNFILAIP